MNKPGSYAWLQDEVKRLEREKNELRSEIECVVRAQSALAIMAQVADGIDPVALSSDGNGDEMLEELKLCIYMAQAKIRKCWGSIGERPFVNPGLDIANYLVQAVKDADAKARRADEMARKSAESEKSD